MEATESLIMKRTFIFAISVIAATMLATACFQEEAPFGVSDLISDEGERTEITVSFSDPTLSLVKVRSSILEGAETVQSGATVYAYLVSGGTAIIDDIVTIDGASVQSPGNSATEQSAKLSLRRGRTYNIYVVGNAWYINKSTGAKASWADAMGADMPADFESGLQTAVHRFDGSDFRGSYRHETLAEVRTYGIPYSGRITGVNVVKDGTISIDNCRFLFAKVNLTVDHTGLDGNLNENYFKNSSVSVRQANGALSVFSDSNRLTASSASIDADGDPSMTNAHRETYTFYVPENMQGNLLGTDNPALKNLDNPLLSSSKNLLTYLEFKGAVNPSNAYASQIGYSGTFTYRFCLGTDNCRNFNVIGGHRYDITLAFTVNGLFNPEAEWKVSSESFTDSRVIDVMKFADCGEALGADQPVIVRANRPGKVFLYANKEGIAAGGTNVARGKDLVASADTYAPADVTDCALCVTPALSILSDYGVTATYSASDASLSFEVTNAAKFASWLASGREIGLTATLLPSKENAKKREFVLKPFADLGVSGDFDDFYVAMRRTVSCSGFYGSNLILYNGSEKAGSPNLKDASTRLLIGNSSHPQTIRGNGSFDVISCRETDSSNRCLLCVSSDDGFNDGVKSIDVTVKRPWPVLGEIRGSDNYLHVHGDHLPIPFYYYTTSGHSTRIAIDSFEKDEFIKVLMPRFSFTGAHISDSRDKVFENSLHQAVGKVSYYEPGYEEKIDAMFLFVYSVPEEYRSRESYPGTASYDIPYYTDVLSVTGLEGITGQYDVLIPALDVGLTDAALGTEGRTIRFRDETLAGDEDKQEFVQNIAGVAFNLRNNSDMDFEIVPRMVESRKNESITASIVSINRDAGSERTVIGYRVTRGPSSQEHSIGYHDVKMYVENTHSKQKIYSDHNYIAKVSQLNALGGTLKFVGCSTGSAGNNFILVDTGSKSGSGYRSFDLYPFAQWKIGVGFANTEQIMQGITAGGLYVMSDPDWKYGATNLFVKNNGDPDSPNYSWEEISYATVHELDVEKYTLRYETFIGDSAGFNDKWQKLTEKEFMMEYVKPRCSLARIKSDGNPEIISGAQNVIVGQLKDTLPNELNPVLKYPGYINVIYKDEWVDILSRRKSEDEE